MKVLSTNGSPHEKGCTYTALTELAKTLNDEGIDNGNFLHWDKTTCRVHCLYEMYRNIIQCAFNETSNDFLDIAKDADGLVSEFSSSMTQLKRCNYIFYGLRFLREPARKQTVILSRKLT